MIKVLPNPFGIQNAANNIKPFHKKTPLMKSDVLSDALNADVWLKNETISPIASFKLRGALNHLIEAGYESAIKGSVTSSTGNHGQGVAYASKLLDLSAHIFLPERHSQVKRTMIETFGGIIHIYGSDLDDAKEEARKYSLQNGFEFVDDGESLAVIEGAGTVGLEIAEELPNIDLVIVPMGSGSLASGVAVALKYIQPNAKVVAVSPAGSPAMVESFHEKKPIERQVVTIADGTVCRVPAKLALDALLESVADAWLVTDEDILRAVHTLAISSHVLVEPSGAVPLAAAFVNKDKLEGLRVVLVLSGANIIKEDLYNALKREPFIQTPS